MQTRDTTNGWQPFARRAALVLLAAAVLGMPVNDLVRYLLLLALAVAAFAGTVTADPRRWLGAIALAAIVVAGHLLFPAPRIEEGFNVFLPSAPGAASPLPADVQRAFQGQFDAQYPPGTICGASPCPRFERGGAEPPFAFSADGIFERPAFSRRVTGIGFSSPAWLRAGVINEIAYNWPDGTGDLKRFERDRRSLHFLDRFKLTLPLYVAYRFPSVFAGSDLCWRGTVLWPNGGGGFDTLDHADFACRPLRPNDTGRTIYAASILHAPPLAMSLRAPAGVQLRRAIEWGLTLVGMLGIGALLVRVERRRLLLPATLIGITTLLTVFVDIHFIGGFRPLDGGDDGITYEGFAREIARHVLAGDWIAALRGSESVYYFTPGFRYFRAAELFLFGDTFLGYFSALVIFPFVVLMLARRFLPARWALGLILLFVATPVGVLLGSTLTDYISAASRGYGDPFAFLLLLSGFAFIVPRPGGAGALHPGRACLGALLMAMATFCRPNLVLAAGMMLLCACVIALRGRQFVVVAAMIAGFAALAVSPLHNYVFGHSTVPFSDNVNQPQTLLMPPLDYLRAARDLVMLDFSSSYIARALAQLDRWLSGTHKLAIAIPFNLAAVLVLLRVGILNRRFAPWLRALALATLLQHAIGACYVNYDRYNLATWLLTAIVCAAWLREEGLPWFARACPRLHARAADARMTRRLGGWLARFQRNCGFCDPAPVASGGAAR